MTKISLRAYDREIEALIEHDQRTDEAIAHCRHILQTFPKHLETYRLLGKAYLEAKRYHEAVDIFERVLVSAPEDFVSHVGMSIIADDQGQLDDAIWHMERAFEMQPANAAIQGELQRLFARRDGVEPPKIRLTRGALARMYMQGELYSQAISEIKAVLASDSKRADMQVLLAKASYLSGQKIEATTISTELLSRYPYCLDANRLMAEILPATQRAEAAQEYRQRVIELDPYAAFANESLFRPESVADGVVSLERLEYSAAMMEQTPALGLGSGSGSAISAGGAREPEWLSSGRPALPPGPQQSEPAPPAAAELPDFLKDAGWSERTAPSPAEGPAPVGTPEVEPAAVPAEIPDWIQAFAPLEADAASEEAPPVQPAADAPDWLAGLGAIPEKETPAGSAVKTPDWLAALDASAEPEGPVATEDKVPSQVAGGGGGRDSEQPATGAATETPDWLAGLRSDAVVESASEATPEADSEVPDWLQDLGGREVDEPAALSKPAVDTSPAAAASLSALPPDETPAWLQDFATDLESPVKKTAPFASPEPLPQPSAEPAADSGELGTTAQEQDDAMAWLEGLAAKHGAKPEELVTDPNARTETAPDWVDRVRQIGERESDKVAPEQAEPAPEAVPSDLDLTGKWLRSLQTGEFAEDEMERPMSAATESPTLAWINRLSQEGGLTSSQPEAENEDRPIMKAGEAPAWLGETAQASASTSATDEVPSWLNREPEATEAKESVGATSEGESSVDLPEWLAGLDEDEREGTTVPGSKEDVPVWLRPESETTPQATEPTKPADWKPAEPSRAAVTQPTTSEPPPEVPTDLPEPAATAAPARESAAEVSTLPKAKAGAPPPRPAAADQGSLQGAQSELGRGNIAAALDVYSRLIRRGKSLEEIIRDLRDALYRYPVEVPIWQALGDAYMRANRLQEALDAYTKAEELLR